MNLLERVSYLNELIVKKSTQLGSSINEMSEYTVLEKALYKQIDNGTVELAYLQTLLKERKPSQHLAEIKEAFENMQKKLKKFKVKLNRGSKKEIADLEKLINKDEVKDSELKSFYSGYSNDALWEAVEAWDIKGELYDAYNTYYGDVDYDFDVIETDELYADEWENGGKDEAVSSLKDAIAYNYEGENKFARDVEKEILYVAEDTWFYDPSQST
jgi:hypothetical protein